MNKKIVIDANFPNETRVVLLGHHDDIEDIEYETSTRQQNKGNIYLVKVTRIEQSLQAVFIEYGVDKSGFLPFSEIHPSYYNLPNSDTGFPLDKFPEIAHVDINVDEDGEKPVLNSYDSVVDSEEIDLKVIEELVDSKIPPEFNLDVADTDVEVIQAPKEDVVLQYKVQEVIKKNQILLAQVTKEARGSKCAAFTTYISFAGKYCVLMPNKALQNGVSRKISNAEERKRLKNIVSKIVNNDKSGHSVIVRTAGKGATALDLKKDYNYLARLWNKIRKSVTKFTAPCFIHEEDGIIHKTIRDMCDNHVKEVLIQGKKGFQIASRFMQDIMPSEIGRLREYKIKAPIFTKLRIEDQLSKLYQPIVPLRSGGYIIINPTEALVAIDVNSGKSTSERNIEETAFKTNLEAAREIAKQVRIRDLSGLIVIDFIDMSEVKNRKLIERSFKEFLSRDRARIQTGSISQFGLLEFSRQRLRSSFLEVNSTICSHCSGKGVVRADESNAMLILRTVENEIFDNNVDVVNVFAHIASTVYLLNNKRVEIKFIEDKYDIKLNFYADPNATSDSYSIEKVRLLKKNQNVALASSKPMVQSDSTDYQEIDEKQGEQRKKQEVPRKGKQKWTVSDSASSSSIDEAKNGHNSVKEARIVQERINGSGDSSNQVHEVVENTAETGEVAATTVKRRYRSRKSSKWSGKKGEKGAESKE